MKNNKNNLFYLILKTIIHTYANKQFDHIQQLVAYYKSSIYNCKSIINLPGPTLIID